MTKSNMPNTEPVWTMHDGKEIPIHLMTDTHLVNAIKMVQRLAKQGVMLYGGGYDFKGENFDACEIKVFGEDVFQEFETYPDLVKEAQKRKLNVVVRT